MQRLILLVIAAIPGLALAQSTGEVVPEPSTMALIAGSVAAAGLYKRLTRKKDK